VGTGLFDNLPDDSPATGLFDSLEPEPAGTGLFDSLESPEDAGLRRQAAVKAMPSVQAAHERTVESSPSLPHWNTPNPYWTHFAEGVAAQGVDRELAAQYPTGQQPIDVTKIQNPVGRGMAEVGADIAGALPGPLGSSAQKVFRTSLDEPGAGQRWGKPVQSLVKGIGEFAAGAAAGGVPGLFATGALESLGETGVPFTGQGAAEDTKTIGKAAAMGTVAAFVLPALNAFAQKVGGKAFDAVAPKIAQSLAESPSARKVARELAAVGIADIPATLGFLEAQGVKWRDYYKYPAGSPERDELNRQIALAFGGSVGARVGLGLGEALTHAARSKASSEAGNAVPEASVEPPIPTEGVGANATQEVVQPAGIPAERPGGNVSGETAEAGGGDSLLPEAGGAAGAPEEGAVTLDSTVDWGPRTETVRKAIEDAQAAGHTPETFERAAPAIVRAMGGPENLARLWDAAQGVIDDTPKVAEQAPEVSRETISEPPAPEPVAPEPEVVATHEPQPLAETDAPVVSRLANRANAAIGKPENMHHVITDWRQAIEETAGRDASEAENDVVKALQRSIRAENANPGASRLAKAKQWLDNRSEQDVARKALTFYIEAYDGNMDYLKNMLATAENTRSTTARSFIQQIASSGPKFIAESRLGRTTNDEAIEAIKYAIDNPAKLADAAAKYREITGEKLGRLRSHGFNVAEAPNFVPREIDFTEGPLAAYIEGAAGGDASTGAKHRMNRKFSRLIDTIAAENKPLSIDAIKNLSSYVRASEMGVRTRQWQNKLFDIADPETGEAIVKAPTYETRRDEKGSQYIKPEPGYKLASFPDGQQVLVNDAFAGLIDTLTKPDSLANMPSMRRLMQTNGTLKNIMLIFDTFHGARGAFMGTMARLSGLKLPSLAEPVRVKALSKTSFGELRGQLERGEITPEQHGEMVADKRILNIMQENGVKTGRISDALHTEWVRKVPVLGSVNKFVFDELFPAVMSDISLLEFKRQRSQFPELSDGQVARKVGREVNTLFGNRGLQGVMRNKTFANMMRLMFLAPSWNEGLIMSELGGAKDIAGAGLDMVRGRKVAMGLLGRKMATTAASLFVITQLINLATRKKPTWENPEETTGAKMSAWIPGKDGTPGFFFNPLTLTAETFHVLMNSYERSGNTYQPVLDYAKSRASALTKPLWTLATGNTPSGRKIRPEERWKSAAVAAIPSPIGLDALINAGRGMEQYPGANQRQLMQSVGMKVEMAPSPEQRIGRLAHIYNAAHGKEAPGEFYPGKFDPLMTALREKNTQAALDEMKRLRETTSIRDIADHFKEWPQRAFTGSKRDETMFLASLTPEQRQQYFEAKRTRMMLAAQGIRILSASNAMPTSP